MYVWGALIFFCNGMLYKFCNWNIETLHKKCIEGMAHTCFFLRTLYPCTYYTLHTVHINTWNSFHDIHSIWKQWMHYLFIRCLNEVRTMLNPFDIKNALQIKTRQCSIFRQVTYISIPINFLVSEITLNDLLTK